MDLHIGRYVKPNECMADIATNMASSSGISACTDLLTERRQMQAGKLCSRVKRAWLWGQKDLGFNSPSPVVNYMILGQFLIYTVMCTSDEEPQTLHL